MVSKPDPAPNATPVEAGPPVEHVAVTQMGGTFAERAAARMKAEKSSAKAVDGDDAEDKAISRASTKTRKTAARKG